MTKVISLGKANLKRAEREGKNARMVGSVDDVVEMLRPSRPLYILRPERIMENAKAFMAAFPGTVMFAMKSNPDKTVIQTLARAGIKSFDCASIEEIRAARKLAPKAKIFFMHPVKAREAIKEAYDVHGVRSFSLDTVEELYKIIQETSYAPDLELFVRISTPSKGKALIPLSRKFGADPVQAIELLQKCRPVSSRLGVAFHVGFQCMDPKQYRKAIHLAASIITQSGVKVDALDVGGGFPSTFANLTPPDRQAYMDEIIRAIKDAKLGDLDLLAEPGQSLVANAGHVVARVELRKGDMLYLNDGVFGCLHDAARDIGIRHPVRVIRPGKDFENHQTPFEMAGPTCTTEDMMPGPYALPSNVSEGDWIEFGMSGAYSMAFRTDFNGFGKTDIVCLYDKKA
jgi:ornithine decarboxylase